MRTYADYGHGISGSLNLYTAFLFNCKFCRIKFFIRQVLKFHYRFLRNGIYRNAGFHGKEGSFSRSLLSECAVHSPFFNVDNREFRIRREAHLPRLLSLIVIFEVSRSAFLIGSHDKPNALLQRIAQLLYGTHSIQRRKYRSLVVTDSSSIKDAVLFKGFERPCHLPALSGRHDVEMSENIQAMRQFRRKVGRSDIIIPIFCRKTVAVTNL